MNIRIELPQNVKEIIGTIEKNGFQAYAVGGCVRDSILGRNPDDWDITTSALPMQVKDLFKRTVDTGIKHGTVTVMVDKTGYEVTTYRIDGEYKDGRHPENVEFSVSLVDDLKRRDFTINAMAYNDNDGLVDEFDGLGDIDRRLIKCVGNPNERFGEDALRMMRAIRFSAQLGFDIDDVTYAAIKELAGTMKKVSMERIQVELIKTLMSDNPEYVKKYQETGLLREILPVIDRVLSGKYALNAMTMLKHTGKMPALKYAALLNTVSPEEVKTTLKTLKLDNYTIDTAVKLVANSRLVFEESEPAVREAIRKHGTELVPVMFEHERAIIEAKEEITGIRLSSMRNHLTVLKRMYDEIIERGDCICVRDLDITGNDLMELGYEGRQIGQKLEELLSVVIENPKMNDKETLVGLLKK